MFRTSDVRGNLPTKQPLCRTCYDNVLTDGTLPTLARLRKRRDGGTVMVPSA